MQKEEPILQCLLSSHRPEQQSAFAAHSLPPVLQLSFNATHVLPSPQLPLQHASFPAQALPSDTHCSAEHLPDSQLSEQQSVLAEHEEPDGVQLVIAATQPVFSSQAPEQQSAPPVQVWPTAKQLLLPAPPLCEAPALSFEPPALLELAFAALPAAAPSEVELEPPQPVQIAAAVIMMAAKLCAIRISSLREKSIPTSTTGAACGLQGVSGASSENL